MESTSIDIDKSSMCIDTNDINVADINIKLISCSFDEN